MLAAAAAVCGTSQRSRQRSKSSSKVGLGGLMQPAAAPASCLSLPMPAADRMYCCSYPARVCTVFQLPLMSATAHRHCSLCWLTAGAAGPPAAADRTTEVIDLDLDSPTAIGGEQQQRRRQQQQQQQQQQQRPRVRRGRGDGAAQVAGKEGKEEEEVQEVVVLDGDSDGGGGDVTPAVAAPAAAAAGAATTAAPVPEEQLLLEFPVGCSECAVCVGNLAEASHVLKVCV